MEIITVKVRFFVSFLLIPRATRMLDSSSLFAFSRAALFERIGSVNRAHRRIWCMRHDLILCSLSSSPIDASHFWQSMHAVWQHMFSGTPANLPVLRKTAALSGFTKALDAAQWE